MVVVVVVVEEVVEVVVVVVVADGGAAAVGVVWLSTAGVLEGDAGLTVRGEVDVDGEEAAALPLLSPSDPAPMMVSSLEPLLALSRSSSLASSQSSEPLTSPSQPLSSAPTDPLLCSRATPTAVGALAETVEELEGRVGGEAASVRGLGVEVAGARVAGPGTGAEVGDGSEGAGEEAECGLLSAGLWEGAGVAVGSAFWTAALGDWVVGVGAEPVLETDLLLGFLLRKDSSR